MHGLCQDKNLFFINLLCQQHGYSYIATCFRFINPNKSLSVYFLAGPELNVPSSLVMDPSATQTVLSLFIERNLPALVEQQIQTSTLMINLLQVLIFCLSSVFLRSKYELSADLVLVKNKK